MSEFTVNKKIKRLKGAYPKIGIRPVIDGRRKGVRESLEEQTMNMAKSVAHFISDELFYSDGSAVDCIITDFCIGGVAEAAEAAEIFEKNNVAATITVTPCWCYGTEVMDTNPLIPKAVWGFNGTERPGAVYLAAALAGYSQKGLPAFGIYGKNVQDNNEKNIPDDVKRKLLLFTKAALAVGEIKNKSYLSIGSVSMGIAGSIIDPDFFHDYLGMRTEFVDMTEIIRRIEEKIYDENEFSNALKWVKKYCKEGIDQNPLPEQAYGKEKIMNGKL